LKKGGKGEGGAEENSKRGKEPSGRGPEEFLDLSGWTALFRVGWYEGIIWKGLASYKEGPGGLLSLRMAFLGRRSPRKIGIPPRGENQACEGRKGRAALGGFRTGTASLR